MVFLSYARKASAAHAAALYQRLTAVGIPGFLDTAAIETGDRFPEALVEKLLSARVVVVFLDPLYLRKWYCLRELRTALAPFDTALRAGANEEQANQALEHIVVVLPKSGPQPDDMDHLPPLLRTQSWAALEETEKLVQLIKRQHKKLRQTLGERIGHVESRSLHSSFLSEALLPKPVDFAAASKPGDGSLTPSYAQALGPSLGETFVGRANDLWRIHFVLSTLRHFSTSSGVTAAIEAGAGFGKTRLALEYFYRFGPRHYPGGIFWIDASAGPAGLTRQLRGILSALRPDDPSLARPEHGRDYAAEVRKILHATVQSAAVLFLVDNVPEGPHPLPLDTWCPALGDVSCLLTSRAKVSLWLEGVRDITIDTLETEPAVSLLTAGVKRAALSEAQWRKIAELTGNLPLALQLLNRSLRLPTFSAAQLLARLFAKPVAELERRYKVLKPHVPKNSLRGVGESFAVSYELLRPPEKKVARILAQLSPDPVPLEVLAHIGSGGIPEDIRATLSLRSFVSPVSAPGLEFFGSMHRLLADYLRSQSRNPGVERRSAAEAVGEAMVQAHSEHPRDWPVVDACLPHAASLFEKLGRSGPQAPARLLLGLRIGSAALVRGQPRRAREILADIASDAVRIWGARHADTLALRANLASALREQGEYTRAEEIQRELLDIVPPQAVGLSNRGRTLLNNLAMTVAAQGRHAEALALRKQHLELCLAGHREVAAEELLMSMNNFATSLHETGRAREAIKYQEQALTITLDKLGAQHPETLITKNNLATAISRGNPQRARELFEQVIQESRQFLGRTHPRTMQSTMNLARLTIDGGDYPGAWKMLVDALEVSRADRGEEDEITRQLREWVAIAAAIRAFASGTATAQEEAVQQIRRTYGDDHPGTRARLQEFVALLVYASNTVARTETLSGRCALLEAIRSAAARVLGEAHTVSRNAANNLAVALRYAGRVKESEKLHREVLRISTKVDGKEHPNTLKVRTDLAGILYERGKYREARSLMKAGVDISRAAIGPVAPQTLDMMGKLAKTLEKLKEPAAEKSLRREILNVCRRGLGDHDSATTDAAWALLNTMRTADEQPEWSAVFTDFLLWLGRADPDALSPRQLEIRDEIRQQIQAAVTHGKRE